MVKRVLISIVICFVSLSVFCQSSDSLQIVQNRVDSLTVNVIEKTDPKNSVKTSDMVVNDTVAWVNDKMEIDKSTQQLLESTKPFKPDPTKAVLYSALFPGLGQIYNQKYWKLPIVYGGFLGFVYAITWNGRMYNDYTKAYKAIMSDDYVANKEDYINLFSGASGVDPSKWDATQLNNFRSAIRNRRDFNRRNRDLSIIGAIAMYALCMIDAYVDAQLYDFDISPDLSFRVEPRIGLDVFSQKTLGVQCSIKF
ncbi:DUF5683 domain-containing protein [Dysgonomonas sp. OttesenSCG-928-M03]|nr:DUF5683 domain-containing protein [Dysgonomonas sp. OttesenSCG-928-M03]